MLKIGNSNNKTKKLLEVNSEHEKKNLNNLKQTQKFETIEFSDFAICCIQFTIFFI